MQIVCPACGLSESVSDHEPGGVFHCASCGKRIRWGERGSASVHQDDDDLAFDLMATAQPQVPRSISRGNPTKFWVVAFAGLITAAVVTMLVLVARRTLTAPVQPSAVAIMPWDRSHRLELIALKSKAEQFALAGSLQQSNQTYQQMLTLVGDHEVTDPVVIEVMAGARAGQDRVLLAMMPNRSPVMAPGPTSMPMSVKPAELSATTLPMKLPPRMTSTAPATQPASRPTTNAMAAVILDPPETAADHAAPLPGPPPSQPKLQAYKLPDAVTDAQIGEAISKGVGFLRGQFRGGEITTMRPAAAPPIKNLAPQREPGKSNLDHVSDLGDMPNSPPMPPSGPMSNTPAKDAFSVEGVDALCVYALLHAGQAMDGQAIGADDPFTVQVLQRLKSYILTYTYHRSLRAAALSVFARAQDNAVLEDDLNWLLSASRDGAYTYTIPSPSDNGSEWDNSNSQYGLLGVWSCAQAGKAISVNYWRSVEQHWTQCAMGDGTWGYTVGTPTVTMTCAGIVSMLVAHDYTNQPNRPGQSPLIDAGLAWLERGDNCLSNLSSNIGGTGYSLYGLERVGLASGFKYFGRHDWYAELAKRLVAEQHFNGSWGANPNADGTIPAQTLVDTAYSLLFLARGRHPIFFNKLRYDGDWNNRPQDVSHLARFAAHELERPLNWQVVNLRRNGFDWLDCPVLYISGDKKPAMRPEDYSALKDFANAGGLIFTHADGGSAEFNHWVAELVRTIFPKYELLQVERDHPLYSTVYRLKNGPPLLSVSNGSRLLLIDSPVDLAEGWQLNWQDEDKAAFQLGVNVFIYAAGKGGLKNRLQSTYIPEDPDQPDSTRSIARLQYAGEYDPEPYALTRFARNFLWETHQAISPLTIQLNALSPGAVPIALLTGTVRYDFTAAECAAANAYVQAGGVLLIDACGGQRDFAQSVQNTLLPQAFAGATPAPMPANHPLLLASRPHADDLSHPMLRGYASEHGGKDLPMQSFAFGKGWVIFSQLDITTGLLGTQSWGILGYDPAYAQALVKNAALWAFARSPEESAK